MATDPSQHAHAQVTPYAAVPAQRPRPVELLREYDEAPARRRLYLPVAAKFVVAALAATAWMCGSAVYSWPWLADLRHAVTVVPAVVVIALVAWLPGWLVAFLAVSLILDRQPPLRVESPTDAVTIIIAARNEAASIAETVRYAAAGDYEGPLQVIVADNGSTDGTAGLALAEARRLGCDLRVVREERPGKSHALNAALATVTTDLVITLDADTLPHAGAVRRLVARLRSAPAGIDAVAGSVLVRNSRGGLWARLQEWDYFLGIASVKRMQGLYQGTLVAQGAFSLYRTAALRAVGGWPDAIGEDIVVTWKLLAGGARVYFEPLAVAFTGAPESFRHLARQRARWARGMIEGLRTVPPWRQPTWQVRALTGLDVLIPALDVGYTLLWLPGLVLACFGVFWVVGPYTLAVLPVTLLVDYLLYRFQRRQVFDALGLRVRKNRAAFVLYVLVFQMLMSPVSVAGYAQELLGLRRRWK